MFGPPVLAVDLAAQAALSLLATFAAVALLAWVLYARLPPVLPVTKALTFLGHANELRNRLLRLFALLGFWSLAFLTVRVETVQVGRIPLPRLVPDVFDNVAARVYQALAAQFVPPGVEVIVSSPTEAVAAQLEIAFLLALVVTFPFLAFETWAFAGPALRERERAFLTKTFPVAFSLFAAGAAFGLALVTPLLFSTLYAFATPLGATQFLRADALVGTLTTMALVFGLAFQLPLAMVALVRFHVVSPHAYLRYWRHWTLGLFILAAVVTDPTLLSQLIVGTLLVLLYWGGVAASLLVNARTQAATSRDPLRTS